MPIPDFQAVMLPVLEDVAEGRDHLVRDVTLRIADRFDLTEDERRELLPSGQQTKAKLNQNHPEECRRKGIRALEAQADEDSRAIGKLMTATLKGRCSRREWDEE